MEMKNTAVKSEIAIRCAKAAVLLSSLRMRTPHQKATLNNEDEEKKTMRKEIAYLKVKLAMERMKNKRIMLCSLAESALQVMVVILVLSFILMLVMEIL